MIFVVGLLGLLGSWGLLGLLGSLGFSGFLGCQVLDFRYLMKPEFSFETVSACA